MSKKKGQKEDMTEQAGMMRVEAEICVYDQVGRLESTQKCRSWLKQFLQILRSRIAEVTDAAVKDTAGTTQSIEVSYTDVQNVNVYETLNSQSAAGSVAYGIVLGTGTTAVTYSDYVIETIIAHGTGAGQLSYAAMGYTALGDVSGGQQFGLTRSITNSSGGSITVNEIALYVRVVTYAHWDSATYTNFCIERTVLGTPIVIADGDTKTFEYRIKLTV